MTRIDSTTNLIARMRTHLRAAASTSVGNQHRAPAAGGRGRPKPDLGATVLSRVSLIDRNEPDRERKALRIFLEAVLLDELGLALADDPRFQDMLDHVQAQFASDPELASAAGAAARQLLDAPVAGSGGC